MSPDSEILAALADLENVVEDHAEMTYETLPEGDPSDLSVVERIRRIADYMEGLF